MAQYYEGGTCEHSRQEERAHLKNGNISLNNNGFYTLCNGPPQLMKDFIATPIRNFVCICVFVRPALSVSHLGPASADSNAVLPLYSILL
jgi:hypothetical protein